VRRTSILHHLGGDKKDPTPNHYADDHRRGMHSAQIANKAWLRCAGLLGSRHEGEYKGTSFVVGRSSFGKPSRTSRVAGRAPRSRRLSVVGKPEARFGLVRPRAHKLDMHRTAHLLLILTAAGLVRLSWAGHTLNTSELQVVRSWLSAHPKFRIATHADCRCPDQLKLMRVGSGGVWTAVPDYHPYVVTGDLSRLPRTSVLG